ncbi:MAG: hypothetical protein J5680_01405 [Neisseriaceae bacterium]|nr:hypothetical protein [Neisseriaceae bacterium]
MAVLALLIVFSGLGKSVPVAAGERKIPIKIFYENPDKNLSGSLKASDKWLINPNQTLIDELHGQLGYKNVKVKW